MKRNLSKAKCQVSIVPHVFYSIREAELILAKIKSDFANTEELQVRENGFPRAKLVGFEQITK